MYTVSGMTSDLPFGALADPVRREILAVLAERGECSAGSIAESIDSVGRTAVSMHLKVLLDAGLVNSRRHGRYHLFSVRADGAAQDVIQTLQSLFDTSLTNLEQRTIPAADEGPDGVRGAG